MCIIVHRPLSGDILSRRYCASRVVYESSAEPLHLVAAVGSSSHAKQQQNPKASKYFITTRSGLSFSVKTMMVEKEAVTISDVLKLFMENQQRQVEVEQWLEEERRQERREEERIRREESERQLELVSRLVERTELWMQKGPSEKNIQLVRLTE